jgi:tRNA(Ile)-lysidine synthase
MGPDPAVAAVRLAVRRSLTGVGADGVRVPAGDLVLVACSGGADSLALAAATAFEAPRAGLRAGAITVDHGLQPGSAERAADLTTALRGLGLGPVEAIAVQVGAEGGPEAAARTARYAALGEAADRHRASVVLLGHTRDDQAETVLLGLARGSGTRSLAGMPAVNGRYRRPLLDVDRALTRAACLAEGLSAWADPHNQDPAYARSRVRAEAMPALERALGPGVAAALARTARLLAEDADALELWAAREHERATLPDGGLDVAALAGAPAAIRSRVLRRAALAAGSPASDLASVHVVSLDTLVTRWHGQGPLQLPGGVVARRRYGTLLLAREPTAAG